jgi:hypothetical protein
VVGTRHFSSIPTNTLKIYDPATDSWSLGANIPILNGSSVSGVIDRKLYVLIALDGYSGYRKRLFVYDAATNSWSEKAQPANIHDSAGAVGYNGKFYVFGGYDGASWSNKVEVYNPANDTWSTLANMPTGRYGLRAEVLGGKIYAIGGYGYGGTTYTTVEIYDPNTNTWAISTSYWMLSPRTSFASGVYNNVLYVSHGSNGSNLLNSTAAYTLTPPVADAGPDLSADVGDTVTLDGSHSYMPGGGSIVNYEWKIMSDLYDYPVLYSGPNPTVDIMPHGYAKEIIRLTVTANNGGIATDDLVITNPGIEGPQGPMGPQGEQGPAGPKGDTGATGPQGPQGLKGDKGDTGDVGPQGEVGPIGPVGPQGLKGDKGDTGDTGPQGSVGPIGPVGPQGPAGMTLEEVLAMQEEIDLLQQQVSEIIAKLPQLENKKPKK